ncbi:hypothetical protein PZ897_07385 [Hoeflea sp. YIM 152468]|uniref:hypothetical protein n=1 Tax=Hoeflea sp. YIM 152468 TaxID=3031759 RepID=UPI0023DB62BD|nr:hypothetical protein [Hoeflea sp. YIM 152468]MDF1607992.1 hypothetical protein [Hoeflea sp. YIM 152468]
MKKIIITLALLFWSWAALADGYVANTHGVEGRYRVFEFTKVGNPARSVSGATRNHVAWPSAIRVGNHVHVFASVLTAGKWSEIRRWTSTGGAAYVDDGAVLISGTAEPNGVGPATVTYDGSVFRIYYLERGVSGPGTSVGLAISSDGLSFTRAGTVYSATSADAGGVSVSYVCTDGDTTHLLLHSYSTDFATASSVIASAQAPDGMFVRGGELLSNSNMHGTISGQAGNSFAQFTGSLATGRVVVVYDGTVSPYIVAEVTAGTVYFDRPLTASYTNSPFADFIRNKADMSFVSKKDGRWVGAVTGYGQFPSVLSEYTMPIEAGAITGPWVVKSGYFASPYFQSGKIATENPEPIRTTSAC